MNDQPKIFESTEYVLELFPKYAISSYRNCKAVSFQSIEEVRKLIKSFYGKKSFILISKRDQNIYIDPNVYKTSLDTMAGVAIVADPNYSREDLLQEQATWHKSYAYFDNLEEAILWAEHAF